MATTENPAPVIDLQDIRKSYGLGESAILALDNLSLTIHPGEFVAIMGPSGCGKTSLLNILGLLDTPDEGDYQLNGVLTSRMRETRLARLRRDHIGIVFQNFNLMNRLTILENVCLPLTYVGMGRIKALTQASEMLKKFGLQEREYYHPHQLSGGQLQRVAIARALVNGPALILADEPTGNLDSKASELIMQELSEIHREGNTIVMVTHNPDLTVWADRIIKMVDGQIASDSKFLKPDEDKLKKRPLGRAKPKTKRKTKTKRAGRTKK